MANEMAKENGVTLFCVGCGGPVCVARPGELLAISCRCGALSPVLYHDADRVHPPFSLISALLTAKNPPHLEYYLGYSDHVGPVRQRVETLLRAIGSTSQAACQDERCQDAYRRGKAEWAELAERSRSGRSASPR